MLPYSISTLQDLIEANHESFLTLRNHMLIHLYFMTLHIPGNLLSSRSWCPQKTETHITKAYDIHFLILISFLSRNIWPSSDLNNVFTRPRRNARDAHDHAVPEDPRGHVLVGKGMAGERQEGYYPLQAIPCSWRRTHDLAIFHHVSGGKVNKCFAFFSIFIFCEEVSCHGFNFIALFGS